MFMKLGLGLGCLIVRHRELDEPGIVSFIIEKLMVQPVGFLMEEKMMRGVRDQAEMDLR